MNIPLPNCSWCEGDFVEIKDGSLFCPKCNSNELLAALEEEVMVDTQEKLCELKSLIKEEICMDCGRELINFEEFEVCNRCLRSYQNDRQDLYAHTHQI